MDLQTAEWKVTLDSTGANSTGVNSSRENVSGANCARVQNVADQVILLDEDADEYQVTYFFSFSDGSEKRFDIVMDPITLTILADQRTRPLPYWAKLDYHQCEGCPLDSKTHEYCPVASSMADVVEEFRDFVSYQVCDIRCDTPERSYLKTSSVQDGLFSIIGMLMAISGCPKMDFFKPMARFHLPFSSTEETMVRTTSMYLLRQYFENKNGQAPDLQLNNLNEKYQQVETVNRGILERIQGYTEKDADKNAIVILNSWAQLLSMEIDDQLVSIEYLFDTGPKS